ncbi:protein kinase domain-containing protein [Dactylosporangium sp. CA-139066]|uniref:serine/threonine-protein kinase n=1 Tax=Dactylosporangium sp. CA-139066 TaxID=3239930 RepID=UPI003D8E1D51
MTYPPGPGPTSPDPPPPTTVDPWSAGPPPTTVDRPPAGPPPNTLDDLLRDRLRQTVPDGPGPAPDGLSAAWLREALGENYDYVGAFRPDDGVGQNEADLFTVRRAGTTEHLVAKIYRPGIEPDRQILETLRSMNTSQVVRIIDIGRYQGRTYEIMEYAAGGSLYSLLRRSHPKGMPRELIRQVALQVSKGLAALHRAGILHRDVKPPNILVRAEAPLDLALSDFGISIAEEAEAFRETRRGSFGYKSPEQHQQLSLNHPPNDWWALGITIAELATGAHPFHNISEALIAFHLSQQRAVPLDGITDPDVLQVCRGLLTRDSANRWGADEIQQWFDGEPPAVVEDVELGPDGEPAPPIAPLLFRGVEYRDRAVLARAFAHSWGPSATRLFESADPAWRRLREWLPQFDRGHIDQDRQDDIDAREAELDDIAASTAPPTVRLVRVIRLLDPLLPPMYLRPDRPLTLSTLPSVAADVVRHDDAADRPIVADLFHFGLLTELAHAREGEGLAELDGQWHMLYREWDALMQRLVDRQPQLAARHSELRDDPMTYAALLWLALSPQGAGAFFRAEAESIRRRLPIEPDWFGPLLAQDSGPVDAACAWLLGAAAQAEAQRVLAEEELAVAEYATRAELEDRYEFDRNDHRWIAIGWACVPLTIVMVVWIAAIVGADLLPFATDRAVQAAWATAVVALLVMACIEVLLAGVIGGPYHPQFSMLAGIVDRVARAANPVRRHGLLGILMLAAGAAVLLALTTWFPAALPVAVIAAHAFWAYRRLQDWNRTEADRAERERQLAARHREAERAGERAEEPMPS